MQGIFLRNLCMKQKAGRLHSILCSTSFAVDDWKIFLISREGAILLYDTTKKDCCTDVQQSFFDAFSAKTTDYSAAIAPVGQAPSQAPQSMQESAFTTAAPFSMVIAPTGQAPSQAPQPTHASETLCAIINSPFLSRADVMYEETYLGTATHAPRNLYPCLHSNKAGRKRQD